jgi:hypothetical protein
MRERRVDPELLDTLPADDPSAVASRADLRRVNVWMGQARLLARLLRLYGKRAPATLLDLGSGDGVLMLRAARLLARDWAAVTVLLADRQDLVTQATLQGFAALGWTARPLVADVFSALRSAGPVDIVSANLFLHHFQDEALRTLLAEAAATARFVAAAEPERGTFGELGSRLMVLIGCNAVTRHDALVSVRAGFAGRELAALLPPTWRVVREQRLLPFTHGFAAAAP